jgi:hypothetical protein
MIDKFCYKFFAKMDEITEWIATKLAGKRFKYLLEKIYHYSTYLSSWSWQKLYSNREKGYGYTKVK